MSESWVFLEWEALNVVGALDSELRAGIRNADCLTVVHRSLSEQR
jgi:hypothetical protein